jgi:hypothetical protein
MKMYFFVSALICLSFYGCKNEVSPCGCAENLRKINNGFDVEFDEDCDKHLDKLNETEAKKWMDEMMKCKSHYK